MKIGKQSVLKGVRKNLPKQPKKPAAVKDALKGVPARGRVGDMRPKRG